MRQFTVFLFTLIFLLFSVGCDNYKSSKAEDISQIGIGKYMYYQSYDDIIYEYRRYVNLVDEVDFDSALNSDVFLVPACGDKSYEWGNMLERINRNSNEEFLEETNNYGYAIKDLNGNGNPELILLHKNDGIMAIITNDVTKITLIDAFWGKYYGYISPDGYIFTIGGPATLKWKLSMDDAKLLFVDGCDGSYSSPRHLLSANGNDISTFDYEEFKSREAYEEFRDSLLSDELRNATDCSAYGLDFIPLFEE